MVQRDVQHKTLKCVFLLPRAFSGKSAELREVPEGSPASSLYVLQVSEAECQGIKSYARFSASTAQRTNVYVIVKFDTCEADVAAEHSESLSCAYNNSLASSCPTVDSDSL